MTLKVRGHHLGHVIHDLAIVELFRDADLENFETYADYWHFSESVKKIVDNETNVKVVAGELDEVCEECDEFSESCLGKRLTREDEKIANEYGIEIGKEYRPDIFISLVRDKIDYEKIECVELYFRNKTINEISSIRLSEFPTPEEIGIDVDTPCSRKVYEKTKEVIEPEWNEMSDIAKRLCYSTLVSIVKTEKWKIKHMPYLSTSDDNYLPKHLNF
jgi:hypothetical protein